VLFQQYGVSTHFNTDVQDFLDLQFPSQLMGQAASISLPAHSPNYTPMDFLLWGFIKDHIYQPPLPTHHVELKDNITAAPATVTPHTMQRVWLEIITVKSVHH
jgi:hypothetical protein